MGASKAHFLRVRAHAVVVSGCVGVMGTSEAIIESVHGSGSLGGAAPLAGLMVRGEDCVRMQQYMRVQYSSAGAKLIATTGINSAITK